MKGKLYLIPTPITEGEKGLETIPACNMRILQGLDYFIVENVRTARRFISSCKLGMVINDLTFVEYSEHTSEESAIELLKPLHEGKDCAIMSEAGVPAIADPGAAVVAEAHKQGIEVIPLVGPSSIILSLMASGLNGESFSFNGYLPIKSNERDKKLSQLISLVTKYNQTQIFIETPYRNVQLFSAITKVVPNNIRLSIAANITGENQYIKTQTIREWQKQNIDKMLHKIPAIFIIGQ